MKNSSILFIDIKHSISRVTEYYAHRVAPEGVQIGSAGMLPVPLSDSASSLMKTYGISESKLIALGDILDRQYDLVITIGKKAREQVPVLPGIPALLHWDYEEPDESSSNDFLADYKRIIFMLESSVKGLFGGGYFNALSNQRIYLDNILDSLSEGIMAHGLDRRIFFFSKGAERITGISRDKVLGHDCHELFSPHFCGSQCVFCDKGDYDRMPESSYDTIFFDEEGRRKEFQVNRIPLRNESGHVIGAIATINDTTHVRELEDKLGEVEQFEGIIGQDHKILAIFELIRDLAQSDFPVIVTGESGTGKELVAAAIHKESSRRDNLFVPINCGALPEGTLESELFGHVKGAFTGAIRDKKGRFELADKGTLFLDEVGELSLPMQVKLLRVLQEGIFEPVGGETPKKVDVRIISATNRNLKEMVAKGTFRDDLFYRLAVVPIELPPLRDRRNDIPTLANHFLAVTSSKLSRPSMEFAEEALSIIMNYNWPGNVRQLQNAIQFAMIKCRGTIILPDHLPPEILTSTMVSFVSVKTPGKAGRKPKLTSEIVERALVRAGGNRAKAARMLGVGRATLYNFMNVHKEMLSIAE